MAQEVTDKLVRMAGERDDSFVADERAFGALSGMQGNALNRESEETLNLRANEVLLSLCAGVQGVVWRVWV